MNSMHHLFTVLIPYALVGVLICNAHDAARAQGLPVPSFWSWKTVLTHYDENWRLTTRWSVDSVEYEVKPDLPGDSILIAKWAGAKRWEVVVRRLGIVDTAYTQELTTGDMVMTVSSYEVWAPSGRYMRFDPITEVPVLAGKLNEYVPSGSWTEFDEAGRTRREYDLCGGWTCGIYREFYINGCIEWSGQFGSVPVKTQVEDIVTGDLIWEVQYITERVGVWEHFLPTGELDQRVTYEWMLK